MGPVYALLLHQWLLLNKDAGGSEQRQKHLNVLVVGTTLHMTDRGQCLCCLPVPATLFTAMI